jgi:hypothetical protein
MPVNEVYIQSATVSQTVSGGANYGYRTSRQMELPPRPTVAQVSMAAHRELRGASRAIAAITSIKYIDSNGQPQTQNFPDLYSIDRVPIVGHDGLTTVTWQIDVADAEATFSLILLRF